MIETMLELADRLAGRVQGHDGETYQPEGRAVNASGEVQDWDWREW